MGAKVKKALKKCSSYTSTVMSTVSEILSSKSIEYNMNNKKTEILVSKSKSTKKDIKKYISKLSDEERMLLDINESDKNISIRLKFK